ncbi:MAG: cation:proton antiporter [Phycisphaerales bacterium]
MHDWPLLNTLAAGLGAAWVLGLLARKVGLSPIVGYMAGGMVIGPFTPGFIGDQAIANELAEIGVILMMFGVGMHFHLEDLLKVRRIAIPGAIVQSTVATLLAMGIFMLFGWTWTQGMVLGMALAVASTVVLLRVLLDANMLNTPQGHAAVGWLIVEDLFTVLALVVVPILGTTVGAGEIAATVGENEMAGVVETAAGAAAQAGAGNASAWVTIGLALLKLGVVVGGAVLAGKYVVPWVLRMVATLRSRELFILTVLVLSISFAVGSAVFFDVSVALAAFLAGMIVAQTPVSHQAASDALPMRDAFAVMFFVSVGMMFDPGFILREPLMAAACLAIVMIGKPLAAFIVVWVLGYPVRTALTVTIALAQIGEFSFILASAGSRYGLLPEEGTQLLVASAIISIALNPIIFAKMDAIEGWLKRRPGLWKMLNARADKRAALANAEALAAEGAAGGQGNAKKPLALVVGYGPTGRLVDALLRDSGMRTCVIETNMETVESINTTGGHGLYGDATSPEILDHAGVGSATHLVVTMPDTAAAVAIVSAAREQNKQIRITARAQYLEDRETLTTAGANAVVFDEGEAGLSMARSVMSNRGIDAATADRLVDALRKLRGMAE